MIITEFSRRSEKEALGNFKNILESIKGLIILIGLTSSDNDVLNQLMLDNLQSITNNLFTLIRNEYGLRKLMKKINNSDFYECIDLDKINLSKNL